MHRFPSVQFKNYFGLREHQIEDHVITKEKIYKDIFNCQRLFGTDIETSSIICIKYLHWLILYKSFYTNNTFNYNKTYECQ